MEREIIGFVFLAIGVNLIGYISPFIMGFRIGKKVSHRKERTHEEKDSASMQ